MNPQIFKANESSSKDNTSKNAQPSPQLSNNKLQSKLSLKGEYYQQLARKAFPRFRMVQGENKCIEVRNQKAYNIIADDGNGKWIVLEDEIDDKYYYYYFETDTFKSMEDKVVYSSDKSTTIYDEKDRKGNFVRDTYFEAQLVQIISQYRLYSLHDTIIQIIAGDQVDIVTQDTLHLFPDTGIEAKRYAEREFESKLNREDKKFYNETYKELRKDYPDGHNDSNRGRVEVKDLLNYNEKNDDKYTGPMTPRSGRRMFGDEIHVENKRGAWRNFKTPSEEYQTNSVEKERNALELPFGAGPSGTIVYALAMLRTYQKQTNNSLRVDENAFALSLAAYLVRRGHHTFFEALAPLNLDKSSKVNFYKNIVSLLCQFCPEAATRANALLDNCYK